MFIPAITDNTTGTGGGASISAANAAVFVTHLKQFISDLALFSYTGGVTCPLVLASYYTHYTLRPVPLILPILGVKVHERVGVQRRRRGKESTYGVSS